MTTTNNRITILFNALNIKQVELADRIGVSQAYISKLLKSNSEKTPSDRLIRIICSEFNANEEWLRTGKGDMFVETDESILAEFTREYKLDDLDRSIIEGYMNLSPDQRAVIKNYVLGVADKYAELDKKGKKSTSKVVTFAAHKDDDSDWTEEEQKEIDAFSKLADELNGDE